ncbi:acyl-CoA dehydrogenase [Saxibacter everestensis]|uniref:Acyl-CoA dehydrogenase n=1 Tax=Saxibacter everestensis TaxID=2909229 RepID=A0ABY8QZM6_9MICO|nr:acyl-CoA dehydrogenase [Brevibacteriaceae bacterium ZFBP1038]
MAQTTSARRDATAAAPAPIVDIDYLQNYLLGQWGYARSASRALAGTDEFAAIEGIGVAEHRARVLEQLKGLVRHSAVHRAFPQELGGDDDHGGNIAGFEELVAADPSLQIKAGVQWGLFGSAVLHLGTEEHHKKWLPGIMNLDIPGAFAMTETGHGSDVANIATTATYQPDTEEFVVHTPFRAAWKDYLGNAALHGRAAVVFAQLVTRGVNHGVHAFFVPIRDEAGNFLPGISGEDDGPKGGLNGVDNGRLCFSRVHIPRTNLLDRYGAVDAEGGYSSAIASPGRRFFTMLGTLVQGRVSLDGAAVVASKLALKIAIEYGSQRRQFNAASDTDEEVLLDYQRHQRRLLPRLATTYATSFAHEKLLSKFDRVFSGAADTDEDRQELETLAAGFKALSTWHAIDTCQEAREACGGAGYLSENRIVGLRADLDVYATFEGDNTVLLQLVAKRLLSDYSKEFANIDVGGVARFVATQTAEFTLNRSGLRKLGQAFADSGSARRAAGQLRETVTQRELLTERVDARLAEVAAKLRPAARMDKVSAARLFNANQDELIETARAHVELLQWEAFTDAVDDIDDPGTKQVLGWLRDLFGLSLIEKHAAWYLMNGRLSMQRARTLSGYINRLLERLRPYALDLVDGFGYSHAHTRAAINSGAEGRRQDEARSYHRLQRATAGAPVHEKTLLARKKQAKRAASSRQR